MRDGGVFDRPRPPSDRPAQPSIDAGHPPGPLITDPATTSSGACAGRTLGDVLTGIRNAYRELGDFVELARSTTDDSAGKRVLAFAIDGGFVIIFRDNHGDCRDTHCSRQEFFYFRTHDRCEVTRHGYYVADRRRIEELQGGCWYLDVGEPLWSVPALPPRETICSPSDVSGTYELAGSAFTHIQCADPPEPKRWLTPVKMTITQWGYTLRQGHVTFSGTGHPWIDEHPFMGTFTENQFTLSASTVLPEAPECRSYTIGATYDFVRATGKISITDEYARAGDTCPPRYPCWRYLDIEIRPQL